MNFIEETPENFTGNFDKNTVLDIHSKFKSKFFDKLDFTCWIAGGIIRTFLMDSNERSDLDLFFPSEDEKQKANKFFKSKGFLTNPIQSGDIIYLYTPRLSIDLIHKGEQNPIDTISRFDFTICSCAMDNEKIYYQEDFFKDNAAKELNLVEGYGVDHHIWPPGIQTRRVIKYLSKGYHLSDSSITYAKEFNPEIDIDQLIKSTPVIDPINRVNYKITNLFFKYFDEIF